VVTEMLVGAQYGLGTRVQNVQITGNIPDLFVTIIVIGLIGVIFNKSFIWLDKRLVFWKSN
jgi:NitT/TauT family transport system permease protein